MREPEDRTVEDMGREPCGAPTRTARQCLAENRDVRVVAAEEPLVRAILERARAADHILSEEEILEMVRPR